MFLFYKKNFQISLFDKDLNLLQRKKYDINEAEPQNIFNKIIFLKDDEKVLSINSKSDTEIRLRYFDLKKKKINIIKIKNEKK